MHIIIALSCFSKSWDDQLIRFCIAKKRNIITVITHSTVFIFLIAKAGHMFIKFEIKGPFGTIIFFVKYYMRKSQPGEI